MVLCSPKLWLFIWWRRVKLLLILHKFFKFSTQLSTVISFDLRPFIIARINIYLWSSNYIFTAWYFHVILAYVNDYYTEYFTFFNVNHGLKFRTKNWKYGLKLEEIHFLSNFLHIYNKVSNWKLIKLKHYLSALG